MNFIPSKSKPISQFFLSNPKKILHISYFSTYPSPSYSSSSSSSSSYSSRRNDEESKNVRVSVWWDIENCSVPNGIGFNVFKISNYITSAVRVNGIKGPVNVTAFGDLFCVSRSNQEALACTGVNLVHIPRGGKNSADRSLLVDLMYWISQNPPPAHVFLISGDRDFAGILHKLRMNNYNILLAGKDGKHTPGVLCSAASIMWHWNELARGENLIGRHFNQPPDGPYNSWYGHYRGPLEDPYEVCEQNSSSEGDNLSNGEASSTQRCHPVPLSILRQLRRIVNAHPEGLTLNELQYAITKSKVPIDKDFYGYKKFSRFLKSIPHIVKFETSPDGQYSVRPVPRKPREPVESNDTSLELMTEKKSQVAEVTRKAYGQAPTITRMVDVEPQLPVSPYVNSVERTADNKAREKTSVKSDVPQRDNQVSFTKEFVGKGSINADAVESPGASKGEQDSNSKIGFFRRLWYGEGADAMETNNNIHGNSTAACGSLEMSTSKEEIKSTNQHGAQQPTHSSSTALNEDIINNNFEKAEAPVGLITRVISWFKSLKSSYVKTPIEESKPDFTEEDSRRFDDGLHPKRHELFSKDTFWIEFFRTHKGSDIVFNSTSRDEIAELLQKEGPLVLRSLQKSDLHDLVDLLVSEKKWISEFPTKTPRFRLVNASVGVSQEIQPQNVQPHSSNGLNSIFQNSSQENPQSRVSSAVHKKPSVKSRSEVLADCQRLLDDLLSQNPAGFNLSLFQKYFLEKYGYPLDHQKLGYPKMVSLIQIMPSVKVESDYICSDKVVLSPGNESLGITDNSSATYSDSPRKNEGDSPWEELGPVAKQERDSSTSGQVNNNYEPLVSDDDEFSESEDATSSAGPTIADQRRSRANEEDSSLLQILDSWYGTSDPHHQGSQAEGFKDYPKEDTESTESSNSTVKEAACARKQRPQKNYTFVADPTDKKDKLIDGILGSLKKSGESKIQE